MSINSTKAALQTFKNFGIAPDLDPAKADVESMRSALVEAAQRYNQATQPGALHSQTTGHIKALAHELKDAVEWVAHELKNP